MEIISLIARNTLETKRTLDCDSAEHLMVTTQMVIKDLVDNNFKYIFLNKNRLFSFKFHCNLFPMVQSHCEPALVQMMVSRQIFDKPLSQSIVVYFTDALMPHSVSMSWANFLHIYTLALGVGGYGIDLDGQPRACYWPWKIVQFWYGYVYT